MQASSQSVNNLFFTCKITRGMKYMQ